MHVHVHEAIRVRLGIWTWSGIGSGVGIGIGIGQKKRGTRVVKGSKIEIPKLSLVVLIGPSGAGKSTFAAKHFAPTEVVSSDRCRGIVSDDENALDATTDAFALVHYIARKRLERGLLTVIDATNVQPEARKPLVAIAREYHALPVGIVFDLPDSLCHERNRSRVDRSFGPHVVRNQRVQMKRSLRGLPREGFRHVFTLDSVDAIDSATITRVPLWNDRRSEHGPFDIIGDVHGCASELRTLLTTLGYAITETTADDGSLDLRIAHAEGRRAVFVGDLVDRGPDTPGVLRIAMAMVRDGTGLCVPGNHETKLLRKMQGKDVRVSHGLAQSLEQLDRETPAFRERVANFIDALVSHYVFDDGKLVVAHAGLPAAMQGRGSGSVRSFALFGETTGETDEYGLPVRHPWANDYRGRAMVVYGHTPVAEPQWLNNTLCVDTGCVFGGRLTALRYPEREIVSVPAERMYYEPVRPLANAIAAPAPLAVQHVHDDVLDIADVLGKRQVHTRLQSAVTVREENAMAALETMSRFAVQPKWLVYLPPTMSPAETSARADLLERPAEAFRYFRNEGVPRVVCEEKHMGSRAVVVLCRDEEVARRRFGIENDGRGICYTRTGRRFFTSRDVETVLLDRLDRAMETSGLWSAFETDWVVLDAELMPWSLKAMELLRGQYASVGAAGRSALAAERVAYERASARGVALGDAVARASGREAAVRAYIDAYRRNCWNVSSIDDVKLAPFHVLATEQGVHVDRDHRWHMETLHRLCAADPGVLRATNFREVDLTDESSEREATAWWEEITAAGGEGMVVKPLSFVTRGRRGLVQPAIKCRGREYLRIIYGPEYLAPENLDRLRARGVSHKRSMALREFALGVEGLERFVRREPLRAVHECAFGVLALECEPVDPRL